MGAPVLMTFSLDNVEVSWLAMAAGFVASMAIGFALFARPVLGDSWMRLVKLDPNAVDKKAAMRAVGISALLSIVLNLGFAVLVDVTAAEGAGEGIMLGLVTWLLFIVPVVLTHVLYEGKPIMVGGIYALHHFLEFAALGALHTSL